MTSSNPLKIGFLGDIFVGQNETSPYVDGNITKMLKSNDFNIANLEGPISKSDNPIRKSGASMRQSEFVVLFKLYAV